MLLALVRPFSDHGVLRNVLRSLSREGSRKVNWIAGLVCAADGLLRVMLSGSFWVSCGFVVFVSDFNGQLSTLSLGLVVSYLPRLRS